MKKIAAIEGIKKLPKLPKKIGYTAMYKKGLSPVQALDKIVKAKQFDDNRHDFEEWLNKKFQRYFLEFELWDLPGEEKEASILYEIRLSHPFINVRNDLIKYNHPNKLYNKVEKGAKKFFDNYSEIEWKHIQDGGFEVKLK